MAIRNGSRFTVYGIKNGLGFTVHGLRLKESRSLHFVKFIWQFSVFSWQFRKWQAGKNGSGFTVYGLRDKERFTVYGGRKVLVIENCLLCINMIYFI